MQLTLKYTKSEIGEIAEKILRSPRESNVFCFLGDLGAGKTTLIKAMCKRLGVEESAATSPSFSIANEYVSEALKDTVYHMDFYRLREEKDLEMLDLESKLSSHYCFIEWPRFYSFFEAHKPLWIEMEEINPMGEERIVRLSSSLEKVKKLYE